MTFELEQRCIIAASSRHAELRLPVASRTLDRLVAYLGEKGSGMKRSRIGEVLRAMGLKWRQEETWLEIEQAVQRTIEYWNADKHPFIWGRR